MTTSNEYVIKGVDRKLLPIICVQSSTTKKIPTEKDFVYSNKSSFGSKIGSITNFATSMYNMMDNFDKNSLEYKELEYRIRCIQDYQQNEIDKSKGIIARPVPKEWYDYKTNKIDELDSDEIKSKKEFNLSILANKKPYFFIYNYQKLKSEWNDYKLSSNDFCLIKFKCTIQELIDKANKTEIEERFIEVYYKKSPVNLQDCTMNKIARLFEYEFDTNTRHHTKGFDKNKFKSSVEYTKDEYDSVKLIKKRYDKDMDLAIRLKNKLKSSNSSEDSKNNKSTMIQNFKNEVIFIGIDKDKLCNIMVDMCYSNDKSKSFAWEIIGETMIKNLINNTGNNIKFPVKNIGGDIKYCGERFEMVEVCNNENNL